MSSKFDVWAAELNRTSPWLQSCSCETGDEGPWFFGAQIGKTERVRISPSLNPCSMEGSCAECQSRRQRGYPVFFIDT